MLRLSPPVLWTGWLPRRAIGDGAQAMVRRLSLPDRRPRAPYWLTLPAILIVSLSFLPLLYLVLRTVEARASAVPLLARERTVEIVINSLVLSAAVAISTIVVGVPLAWLTSRTDLPARGFWSAVLALPLAIPSYIGAVVIVSAFGPRGMLQAALAPLGVERLPSLYGFAGCWLILTLFTYPYVYLSVRAALRNLDPSLEDAARSLGNGSLRTFLAVTVPQIRPAATAGALLAALYTLGDFGVPTLLRYDTFTRALYVQYRSALDRGGGAILALLLALISVIVLAVELRARGNATLHRLGAGVNRRRQPVALGRARVPALLFCAAVALIALVIPIAVLIAWLARAIGAGADFGDVPVAALHSITIGFWTALVATLCALPIATLLVRYPGTISRTLERLTYVGYALPGLVVALAFVAFAAGTPLYQTLAMLVAALVVRFLPQAIGAVRAAFLHVNPRLEEAARGLGRGQAAALVSVTFPLARMGILTGAALVMLTAMKELPATLLLHPTGWNTLATEVWTAANDAAYGQAAGSALVLILIATLPMVILTRDGTGREQPW